MKITVAGLGPGDIDYILPVVKNALQKADVVIGYDYYFQFGASLFKKEAELKFFFCKYQITSKHIMIIIDRSII